MSHLITHLNLISAALAFGAALAWLMSARVYLPQNFKIHTSKAIGSSGIGTSAELDQLGRALKYQGKLSALAAGFAAASALVQAFVLGVGSLG
jgi:hypothetical protein